MALPTGPNQGILEIARAAEAKEEKMTQNK